MRAVIIVGGQNEAGFPPADRCPAAMLWLVDRPVIHHVCEAVLRMGVKDVTWVHSRPADETRKFLGNGERWGGRFDHLAADDTAEAYRIAKKVVAGSPVLLGHADRIPSEVPTLATDSTGPVLGGTSTEQSWVWSGWAALPEGVELPDAETEIEFLNRLAALAGSTRMTIARPKVVRSFSSYLSATHAFLKDHGGVQVSGRARVHPTAKLIGPVQVGPGVVIGANAVVGPFVAVGPNSVIDRDTQIAHSTVLPDTYVGRGLSIRLAVVDRNRVVHMGPDGQVMLDQSLPVGDLAGNPLTKLTPALASHAKRLARTLRRVPAVLTRSKRRMKSDAI